MRPYTLVDVLASIADQAGANQPQSTVALTVPLSEVGEADEQITAADSVFGSAQSAPGWDQGVWGVGTWG